MNRARRIKQELRRINKTLRKKIYNSKGVDPINAYTYKQAAREFSDFSEYDHDKLIKYFSEMEDSFLDEIILEANPVPSVKIELLMLRHKKRPLPALNWHSYQ